MHHIVADTETGGLYPASHALLSIGAVSSWGGEAFLIYITPESQPGKTVEPEAAAKNGYSAEKWEALGAVPLEEGFGRFLGWLEARRAERENAGLWCHNLAFDRGFLGEAERLIGLRIPHRHDWRCSQSKFGELMDKGLLPRGSSGLDRLIELSGYGAPRGEVHDSLEDCHATLHGLRWLLQQERLEVDTLRALYAESLKERVRLEEIICQRDQWLREAATMEEMLSVARGLHEEAEMIRGREAA